MQTSRVLTHRTVITLLMSAVAAISTLSAATRIAATPQPAAQTALNINAGSPFEVDGNVATNTTRDWDKVFANASAAAFSVFVTDAVNSPSDDIFKGGGSKDIRSVQQGPWLFDAGKPEPRKDIAHAFSALYIDPGTSHLFVYAGMDRFDRGEIAGRSFWFMTNRL